MKLTRRVAPVLTMTALLVAGACAGSRSLNPDTVTFLECAQQPGTVHDQKQIGPPGGQLGNNVNGFVIPGKALTATADFVLSRPAALGRRVGVSVEGTPPPLAFRGEGTVFISFAHCTPTEVGDTARWKIARFPNLNAPGKSLEGGRIGNVLYGYTDHNSVFVVLAD